MELDDILELKFKDDKFRLGTVGNWIDGNDPSDPKSGSVREQLRSYITGDAVQEEIAGKKFRALAVVIIDHARYSCVRWIGMVTGSASFSLR